MSPINRFEGQQWPADCHKLKRDLVWPQKVLDLGNLERAVVVILAIAATFVILILLVCGVKRQPRTKTDSVGQQPVHQEDLPETLQVKTKKKLDLKRLMRRRFRRCCVQTQAQAREHELKIRKKVAVHKEHSQRKLDEWVEARERSVQRKKEKLERRIEKEYSRLQKSKREDSS